MRTTLASLILALAVLPAVAQQPVGSRSERWMRNCDDYDRDYERFCEIRDVTIKAPASDRGLFVDGRDNGGVAFYGWDKNEVLVRALIQATGDTRAEAQGLAKEIRVLTDGDRIRADGPASRRHSWWSVSYEVWVPRKMNLDADTHNGGITVEGVEGRIDLRAVNGGITLREVGGNVRAETTNGGVSAALSGSRWNGDGLDLQTTNGSVGLEIPRGYNAELETGTVNGGMNIDFPITVQGFIGRRITTKLGAGGPRVRATTTNGAVRIRER
ncbi:MAG TPA: DUF4097 family beta strand repeat-containing protein [Gemmatimonadaceae bacterium]|nr:DUF4097 family beta strand repeat-containing protein [Gemmatimonadaceae bacterium]